MNELQKKIFNIIKEIHKICINNDIKYSLCGGSMIGAVREKGIIPWDDDIDIFMTPENYQKFIRVAKNYKSDKIEFLLPSRKNYIYTFIKAVDKTTTVIEKIYASHIKYAIGVFVDIFPLVGVKKNNINKRIRARKILQRFMVAKLAKTEMSNKQKLVKPFVWMFPISWYKKLMLKFNNTKENIYYYDPDGYNIKGVFPKEWLDEYILMPFEDTEFYVMKEYDKYLTQVFGNYMQRPNVEKQIAHNFAYLNLDKPFEEYIAEQIATKKKK